MSNVGRLSSPHCPAYKSTSTTTRIHTTTDPWTCFDQRPHNSCKIASLSPIACSAVTPPYPSSHQSMKLLSRYFTYVNIVARITFM